MRERQEVGARKKKLGRGSLQNARVHEHEHESRTRQNPKEGKKLLKYDIRMSYGKL